MLVRAFSAGALVVEIATNSPASAVLMSVRSSADSTRHHRQRLRWIAADAAAKDRIGAGRFERIGRMRS